MDDEGDADVKEIRTVLDRNENTLKHLILGGGPSEDGYWDVAFESVTIDNLTHLDLVGFISVSHFVLTRIASTHNLQSLTLKGSFVDPDSASVVFASDRIVNGMHTLMPHLETFRLNLEERDVGLYRSVIHSLRKREKLRRLDLGSCPWDMVRDILPDLKGLRVLYVDLDDLSKRVIKTLVESIPTQMVAIKISADELLVYVLLSHVCVKYLTCSLERICSIFHTLQHTLVPIVPSPIEAHRCLCQRLSVAGK